MSWMLHAMLHTRPRSNDRRQDRPECRSQRRAESRSPLACLERCGPEPGLLLQILQPIQDRGIRVTAKHRDREIAERQASGKPLGGGLASSLLDLVDVIEPVAFAHALPVERKL